MRRFYLLGILLSLLMLGGCDEVFEYHPNAIRLDEAEQDLTNKNINQLGAKSAGDTIKLLLMGDTQRFYDHIQDFVVSASKHTDIDFMLHAGDISDFGMAQEFRWVHSLLKELPFPYLTVIGNHDLLANGRKVYEKMYGPANYFFDYGGKRFIMLDANSREYNFNGKVPDLDWLESSLNLPEGIDEAVVVCHIPPFDADFDQKLAPRYAELLKKNSKVRLSLHGHQHSASVQYPYGDEINFVITTSMKGRGYYIIEMWEGGFDIHEVTF